MYANNIRQFFGTIGETATVIIVIILIIKIINLFLYWDTVAKIRDMAENVYRLANNQLYQIEKEQDKEQDQLNKEKETAESQEIESNDF